VTLACHHFHILLLWHLEQHIDQIELQVELKNNTKKKPKKKFSERKGTVYEQDYLITILTQIIPSKRRQEEIKDLLRALVSLNHFDEAKKLQKSFEDFISDVEKSIDLLNTPKILSEEE